ncbi:MAG: hypothetical protein QXO47_10880 [Thermoproteota archaeon]
MVDKFKPVLKVEDDDELLFYGNRNNSLGLDIYYRSRDNIFLASWWSLVGKRKRKEVVDRVEVISGKAALIFLRVSLLVKGYGQVNKRLAGRLFPEVFAC